MSNTSKNLRKVDLLILLQCVYVDSFNADVSRSSGVLGHSIFFEPLR